MDARAGQRGVKLNRKIFKRLCNLYRGRRGQGDIDFKSSENLVSSTFSSAKTKRKLVNLL